MPALTIELNDNEYFAILYLPKSELRRTLSLAANRYATAFEEVQGDEPISKADLKAISEILADRDAGRLVDGNTFFASLVVAGYY